MKTYTGIGQQAGEETDQDRIGFEESGKPKGNDEGAKEYEGNARKGVGRGEWRHSVGKLKSADEIVAQAEEDPNILCGEGGF